MPLNACSFAASPTAMASILTCTATTLQSVGAIVWPPLPVSYSRCPTACR